MNWIETLAVAGAKMRLDNHKKEVYKLSRLLPEEEGLRLVEIYEDAIRTREILTKWEGNKVEVK